MGKLVYLMNVSLDGYVETADRSLAWTAVDDELHTWFNERTREAGALLYGRRLYEVMAAYWPTADRDPAATPVMLDFARAWVATPKVVFSTTLTEVGPGCRLVRGDVAGEVARLREEVDGDLQIGGPTLAAAAIELGLVDEYQLVVHPVILGGGRPYLPTLERPIELRRIETRPFGNGAVYLGYEAVR